LFDKTVEVGYDEKGIFIYQLRGGFYRMKKKMLAAIMSAMMAFAVVGAVAVTPSTTVLAIGYAEHHIIL
jgi:hypothetical protein